ncbi:MAG: Flp family type IVb pilin [Actinomycetota bacterium]
MTRITSLLYGQRGQTTAEYALVLLVAGLIVGVFAAFVKSGSLSEMFESIVSGLVERADG